MKSKRTALKEQIGIGPTKLIYRGKEIHKKIKIHVMDFNLNEFEEKYIHNISELLPYKDKNTVTWCNIEGLSDVEFISQLGNEFKIPNILLSNIFQTDSRSRIMDTSDYFYSSIKMLEYNEKSKTIEIENLSIIFSKSIIFTFQEHKGDIFDSVRNRIRTQKTLIRKSSTDYMCYALIDLIIDHYIYVMNILGEYINELEDSLFDASNQEIITKINTNRQKLNFIQKNIKPTREMILNLYKSESELIHDETLIFFKELISNIDHVNDLYDNYREILSDQLNIYNTNVNSRLNEIMKVLTIFSAVFIPLTFIAGIYGMNFDNMPELHFKYAYFIVLSIMVLVVFIMLLFFKRKKWF
ncbi:magnesium/cobalt transporter CorA [Aureivirga sp. CE67]|uniref:magnesium/cobalt transporter CorA n=1 Tax=Aureivirga sp. CE67 TaxID=1788983 RepID=UPI0018CBAD22|nr:magnesium/cobalt transporter CorA [Aureivirga sp. CE67]